MYRKLFTGRGFKIMGFLWMLVLGCFISERLNSGPTSVNADPSIKVTAVTGYTAALPCDLSLPESSDELQIVVWYKNGRPIYSYDRRLKGIAAHWADNMLGERVFFFTEEQAMLTIRDVIPTDQAVYYCRVHFNISQTMNISISLLVIDKPVCKNATMSAVGVIRNKRTEITCEVDAKPEPETFQWVLTNSSGMFDLESEKFTFGSLKSTISFTTTKEHYGIISCKATNRAGQQVEPCQYNLVTGVKPGKLQNCLSDNITNDAVELKCAAGYDGGLQTMHTVEAWQSKNLLRNVSSLLPVWKLHGIGSGKALKLVFYSQNARGRSESSILRVTTLSRLPVLTEPNWTNEYASWLIAVIVGFATAIFIVILLLVRKRFYHSAHTLGSIETQANETNGSTLNENQSPMQLKDESPNFHSKGPLLKDTKITGGILPSKREIVTTRTPFLAHLKESFV